MHACLAEFTLFYSGGLNTWHMCMFLSEHVPVFVVRFVLDTMSECTYVVQVSIRRRENVMLIVFTSVYIHFCSTS